MLRNIFASVVVAASFGHPAHAQNFSCGIGDRGACLGFGDTVCSSQGRCVNRDALCFDRYQCDYEGFTCQSNVTACVQDYNFLLDDHNRLVRDYNDLLEGRDRLADDYNELLDDRNALAGDYNGLLRRHNTLVDDFGSLQADYNRLVFEKQDLEAVVRELEQLLSEVEVEVNRIDDEALRDGFRRFFLR